MIPGAFRSRRGWVFFLRWGPLCLWMATIGMFSTGAFSAEQTGRSLDPFLRWLLPGASVGTIQVLHGTIRKWMHVVEFAILALLWYRSLSWGRRDWQRTAALKAFGLTILLAVGDEVHQAFVPSRIASAIDVAWDSLGALCGLAGWGVLGGALLGERPNAQEGGPLGSLEAPAGD
jgi:VanZ family protein